MQDYLWRHRIVVVLVLLLAAQVPFIVLILAPLGGGTPHPITEVGHVVVTSGLAAYLFSKRFESWLEHRLYGGLRKQWKEVRVMYSDGVGKGLGKAYPREPTILLQAPVFHVEAPEQERRGGMPLDREGYSPMPVNAPYMHGPVCMSFNTGYVGEPAAGENTRATGKWSDLRLMQVGFPGSGHMLTVVGFPNTLITVARSGGPGD